MKQSLYLFQAAQKCPPLLYVRGRLILTFNMCNMCWFDTLPMCITIKKAKEDQSSVSIQLLYKEYTLYNISDDAKYLALYLLKIHLLAHPAWCTVHTHISYCQLRHCPASIGEFGQRKSKLHKNVFLIHCKQGGC